VRPGAAIGEKIRLAADIDGAAALFHCGHNLCRKMPCFCRPALWRVHPPTTLTSSRHHRIHLACSKRGRFERLPNSTVQQSHWGFGMPRRLQIIDTSDYIGQLQALGLSDGHGVVNITVKNRQEFIDKMNNLIKQRLVFDRVVFRTHGFHTGIIWFGDNKITDAAWPNLAKDINFKALFPGATRVMFAACESAYGEEGDKFMTAAGKALLAAGGGVVQGWTSSGLGMPGFLPWIGGHDVRPLSSLTNGTDMKTYYFKAGGDLKTGPIIPPAPEPMHIQVVP
jgi:hypothetical protein